MKIVRATHPLNMYIVAELSKIDIMNVTTYIPRSSTIHIIARIFLMFFIP